MKKTTVSSVLTKIVCMMLAALLCLSLFACDSNKKPSTTTTPTTGTQDPNSNPNPDENPNPNPDPNPNPGPVYSAEEQIADKFVALASRIMAISSEESTPMDDETKAELKETFLEEFVPIYAKNIVTEQELLSFIAKSEDLVTSFEGIMNEFKQTQVEPDINEVVDLVIGYYNNVAEIFTMQRFGEITYDMIFVYFDMMMETMANQPDEMRAEIAEIRAAIEAGVIPECRSYYEEYIANEWMTMQEVLEELQQEIEWMEEELPYMEEAAEQYVQSANTIVEKLRETVSKDTFADITNILYFTINLCFTEVSDVLDFSAMVGGQASAMEAINLEAAIALFQNEVAYIAETATDKITEAEWQSFVELVLFYYDHSLATRFGDANITIEDMIAEAEDIPAYIRGIILSFDIEATANEIILLVPALIDTVNELVQDLPVDDILALLEITDEAALQQASSDLVLGLIEDNKDALVAFLGKVEACLAMGDESAQYQAIVDAELLEAYEAFAAMMDANVTASAVIDALLAAAADPENVDAEALGQYVVSYGFKCAPYAMFVVFYEASNNQDQPQDQGQPTDPIQ